MLVEHSDRFIFVVGVESIGETGQSARVCDMSCHADMKRKGKSENINEVFGWVIFVGILRQNIVF
jgi:hypothetical protein